MFGKRNIIFNTRSNFANCDDHVGCLSFKTVFEGEEWYGIKDRQLAVRPGHFLMLNDQQNYSCRIDRGNDVRTFSIFFEKNFARTVHFDMLSNEMNSLDYPEDMSVQTPAFFQTLYSLDQPLKNSLFHFVQGLNQSGYDRMQTDEFLIDFLTKLIAHQISEANSLNKIASLKASTRNEIYKRLCIAKDYLHSYYKDHIDLDLLSKESHMSVPQLVRNFKALYQVTPHQLLMIIRINHAAHFLRSTDLPVSDIATQCGFEDTSAFSRAFRLKFLKSPSDYRRKGAI